MNIVNEMSLNCNTNISINFDGGSLSSDSGMLLVKDFIHKIGLDHIVKKMFHTNDTATFRIHTDDENLLQTIYQIIAGYFEDDRCDDLKNEPVLTTCPDKPALASQPTMSRFYNRMDLSTLQQFREINKAMREVIYKCTGNPLMVIFDLDSTLLPAYGSQDGVAWNYHYQSDGYHPLLCYDALTGDLIRAWLRGGTDYSSKGVAEFMLPVLEEYTSRYRTTNLFVRGDSGFATPELYELCERFHCQYAIRLKENAVLHRLADGLLQQLYEENKDRLTEHAEIYGEFEYQAGTWSHPRRVVCKIEKPAGVLTVKYTFVVTTRTDPPKDCIQFYCARGNMENFIKEGKNGFDFGAVSSHSMTVNANRLEIHALAYNIVNWMKRLILPDEMKTDQIDTIRLKIIKVASKIVHHGRKRQFKMCSSCTYQSEIFSIIENIGSLRIRPCSS